MGFAQPLPCSTYSLKVFIGSFSLAAGDVFITTSMIFIFSAAEVTAGHAAWATNDWIQATNDLVVPRKDSKDEFGTTVPVFGIEIDPLAMEARLPREKMDKLAT